MLDTLVQPNTDGLSSLNYSDIAFQVLSVSALITYMEIPYHMLFSSLKQCVCNLRMKLMVFELHNNGNITG